MSGETVWERTIARDRANRGDAVVDAGLARSARKAAEPYNRLSTEARAAMIAHGYAPDIAPRGVSGDTDVFMLYSPDSMYLRNHVCELDGIEIDGHEGSDLDPNEPMCIHCGKDRW